MRHALACAGIVLLVSHTAAAQPPTLAFAPEVVVPGTSATATITGPPGHVYAIVGSVSGAGASYGGVAFAAGTDATIIVLGQLDGAGQAVVSITPPFLGSVLDRFYYQVATSPTAAFSTVQLSPGRILKNADLLGGVVGQAGATGATGPAGAVGATGAAGTPGAAGATGAAGPTGATGTPGVTGATGAAGANGATGATGASGPTGAQGLTGASGATGPSGTPGAQGPIGPTGSTGQIGSTGLVYEGTWSVNATYDRNDAVYYPPTGSSYISLTANNGGNQPDLVTTSWGLLARGATPAVLAYGDFFAYMDDVYTPPTLVRGGAVEFPWSEPGFFEGITRDPLALNTRFILQSAGIYEVTFQVGVEEPGRLTLKLNGVERGYPIVGRAAPRSQIVGTALIRVGAGETLEVVNPSDSPSALTISPALGGRPVTARLVIKRLS